MTTRETQNSITSEQAQPLTSAPVQSSSSTVNGPPIDRQALYAQNTSLTSRQHVDNIWQIWNAPDNPVMNVVRDVIDYAGGNRDDFRPPKGGWVDRMNQIEDYIKTKVPAAQRGEIYNLLERERATSTL